MPMESFDALDAVPEELRERALETKEGKFVVFREEDTTGLKSALEKEREAARREAKQRKEIESRLRELELEAKATKEGLTSEKLAEIRKQVAAEFEPYKEKAAKLEVENRTLKLDAKVKAMLGDFVDVNAAWKLFGDEFDLTDDGVPVVKAEPGKSLEKHIADLAERHPYLVRGTQAAGGGARGNAGGTAPSAGDNVFAWTTEQRAAFIRTNGLEAYNEKLAAAQVSAATRTKAA